MANGDGLGAVFFTQGCSHRCPGCQNPQTWDPGGGMEFTNEVLDSLLKYYKDVPFASRLTVSGGDPLDSPGLALHVITEFKHAKPDGKVWLYTGYTYEDVHDIHGLILDRCDVVVDGPFIKPLRDITLKYRGSGNQRLIDVNRTLENNRIVLLDDPR